MKKWQIAVVAVTVVAVAVAALFGGRAWGQSGSSNDAAETQTAGQGPTYGDFLGAPGGGSMPAGPGGANRSGGNLLGGSIIAADDSTVTIQTADGSTKIVLISGSTTISVTEEGSLADLVVGEQVAVTGTSNSDGTLTATSIRLGSDMAFAGSPGGTAPPSGSTPTTAQ